MTAVYVLVYAHGDERSISNMVFFSSEEEAWNWKKDQIAKGNCGNTIKEYCVRRLESL